MIFTLDKQTTSGWIVFTPAGSNANYSESIRLRKKSWQELGEPKQLTVKAAK